MVSKERTKRKAVTEDVEGLSSSAQKRQVRKERQKSRRHAVSVEEAKMLWNKLRLKTNSSKDIEDLMDRVMVLIRGKVNAIALQHDASRVVQAAVQFGNEEQRKEILTEVCKSEGSLAEMAKIQYAHFCCLKFIKYCARDDANIKMIVKSFKGEMKTLAVHAVGASVVEFMFLNLPARQTASLKQEFYGPHFSLFGVVKQGKNISAVPTLKSNIESATTDTQKKSAIDFVQKILNKGMTKNFYGFTYFQQLFAEYIDVVEPSEIRAVSSTIADHSIHLLSTRVGTRVVAACASYGTPKDRKRICKSLKGYTSSSLLHRDAYLALLRLIQVTDDTVSIQKSVLNEILTKPKDGDLDNSLLELALSDTGSKLFLMLLVKDVEARMKYFDPYERSILEQIPTMKDNGKEVPTSKKDPEIRRNELLKHINDPLIEICIGNVQELLTSLPGSRVMKEVYTSFPSERLANAIVDACETSLTDAKADKRNEEEKSAHFSLFEDPIGHRSIKSLILCDADSSSKPCVSKILLDRLGNRIPDISGSNRGAFVAAALFKVQPLKVTAKTMFNPHNKYIKAKSKAKGSNAGYIALLKEMDSN